MELSIGVIAFLSLCTFLTAALSTVAGLGGGLVLQGFMAIYFPPIVLIPLHGSVQLVSNFTRCFALRKFVLFRIFKVYFAGALAGALLALFIVVKIPDGIYFVVMGTFILLMTWLPVKKLKFKIPYKFTFVGIANTFLACLVGGTGPFIAPFFLDENLNKEEMIAGQAICQGFTHLLKVLVFLKLGFDLLNYLPLLISMIVATILGTYLGRMLLYKMDQKIFMIIFKATITILSVRMLYVGFQFH